jgi:uncharacterized membrane protein
MNKTWTTAGAVGLGAGMMYALDPDRGPRRRALLRDKLAHLTRISSRGLRIVSMDLLYRAQGAVTELSSRYQEGAVPDRVLAQRVRAKIGRVARHPHAIEVAAKDGRVVLTGPVFSDEPERLSASARSVRGVRAVEDRLAVLDELEASLRGEPVRQWRSSPPPPLPEQWGTSARFLACASGAALAVYGLRRGGAIGLGSIAAGGALFARGFTNRELKLVGAALATGLDLGHSTQVAAPIDRVFELCQDPNTLAHALGFVREIQDTGNGRLHWRVRGPSGTPLEWDTVFTRIVPNELIAWRTVRGSVLEHSGTLRMQSLGTDCTRVELRLCFEPPAVGTRRALLALFTRDPESELHEDLERLRAIAETRTRPVGTRRDEAGSSPS